MVDKLNGRSRDVLDALREGRHAPVLPAPAPSPAPETRPCVICESTLTAERVRRYPRALTCSADCSIEHQVRLNRVLALSIRATTLSCTAGAGTGTRKPLMCSIRSSVCPVDPDTNLSIWTWPCSLRRNSARYRPFTSGRSRIIDTCPSAIAGSSDGYVPILPIVPSPVEVISRRGQGGPGPQAPPRRIEGSSTLDSPWPNGFLEPLLVVVPDILRPKLDPDRWRKISEALSRR